MSCALLNDWLNWNLSSEDLFLICLFLYLFLFLTLKKNKNIKKSCKIANPTGRFWFYSLSSPSPYVRARVIDSFKIMSGSLKEGNYCDSRPAIIFIQHEINWQRDNLFFIIKSQHFPQYFIKFYYFFEIFSWIKVKSSLSHSLIYKYLFIFYPFLSLFSTLKFNSINLSFQLNSKS